MNLCQDKIHHSQHVFLPEKSCMTQLLPFAHDISLTLNNFDEADVVYFDFAKAFDSVKHDIILKKLKSEFGINGFMLKFMITDYLRNRKQRVVVGGTTSTELDVISGVPQGSILGPLLFVLFINDMHDRVSPNTNIALYADDTKIWRNIHSWEDYEILQRDIGAYAQIKILYFIGTSLKLKQVCKS